MKELILALLLVGISCEMLVTKEFTDYLKKHVTWEVQEYDDNPFRGWTLDEAEMFLGGIDEQDDGQDEIPHVEVKHDLPTNINSGDVVCDTGPMNQGQCGAGWAFAAAGMLAHRCCLQAGEIKKLSVQELVNCDKKSRGCRGGFVSEAVNYAITSKGLANESCIPYTAKEAPCPTTCVDNSVPTRNCTCLSGLKACGTVEEMKTCLSSGPVTVGFEVCQDFFSYKGGIYSCTCGDNIRGLHVALAMYMNETDNYYFARNSWGTSWGEGGYFKINATSCGVSGKYLKNNVMCEKVGPQPSP